MAEVQISLHEVVDLTEPSTQQHYGIDQAALTADNYTVCQQLARRLRAEGVEALWTYSRADQPEGRQLVVFLDQLKQDSEVKIMNIRSITL